MRRILRAAAIALVLTMAAACSDGPAKDQAQPAYGPSASIVQLTGRVTDAAGILPPEAEVSLSARLEQLERTTGHQAVVVTVPSLDGRSVASVTNDLGNAFRIGGKDADGVILLVAPNERRVRITVGYALERTLTDDLCSEIIQSEILPRFREGDLPSGIVAGVDALASHLE
jgi:uncharacterized protein